MAVLREKLRGDYMVKFEVLTQSYTRWPRRRSPVDYRSRLIVSLLGVHRRLKCSSDFVVFHSSISARGVAECESAKLKITGEITFTNHTEMKRCVKLPETFIVEVVVSGIFIAQPNGIWPLW